MTARRRTRRTGAPTRAQRIGLVALAGLGSLVGTEVFRRAPLLDHPAFVRTNHRGDPVNLVAGPVVAATASVLGAAGLPAALRAPALVLGLGSGAVGLYDDIAGARADQRGDKGFRGHLSALRAGRVSAGAVKVVALVVLAGYTAGSVARGPVARVVAAGVIAGSANLVNLLDLRPGRAAKACALAGVAGLTGPAGGAGAAVLGSSLGILPADLGEKVMLGDAGANALGALIGLRIAAGASPVGRAWVLAVLVALTAASEKVSFTRVIESTPGLREFDRWGRLPAAD